MNNRQRSIALRFLDYTEKLGFKIPAALRGFEQILVQEPVRTVTASYKIIQRGPERYLGFE